MTHVYRSAITSDRALALPGDIRNSTVLLASLSTELESTEDCWDDHMHVTVNVQRRQDATYRFLIEAHQPSLEIAGYEVLSREEIDAQLKWMNIDPTPTIQKVTALVREHTEKWRRQGVLTGDRAVKPTAYSGTMTREQVYQRIGEFHYRVFPHEILIPIIDALRSQIQVPGQRLEERVAYVPQRTPFNEEIGAYVDVGVNEFQPKTIADTLQAIVQNCITIPFATAELQYEPASNSRIN